MTPADEERIDELATQFREAEERVQALKMALYRLGVTGPEAMYMTQEKPPGGWATHLAEMQNNQIYAAWRLLRPKWPGKEKEAQTQAGEAFVRKRVVEKGLPIVKPPRAAVR